jgi:hypothetical protein
MVSWLTATTLVLFLFFLLGGHIRLWFGSHPLKSTGSAAASSETASYLIDNAILSGLVPGDLGGFRQLGAKPLFHVVPASEAIRTPHLEFVRSNWTPYFFAMVTWTACLPAAGLLGLRFLLLPLMLRWQRPTLGPETRRAAAIAADATVASAAISASRLTVGFAAAVFVLCAVLPNPAANALVRAEPTVILGILGLSPPVLVAVVIARDRSRRVFAWPKVAALLTFLTYFIGIGLGLAVIATTFRLALWALTD